MNKKPPYVVEKKSGFYWQPRGRMATVSKPEELGRLRDIAYAKGWSLYYACQSHLNDPKAAPEPYSIAWAAAAWRKSEDFKIKSDGDEKSPATVRAQNNALKAIDAEFGGYDLRAATKKHLKGFYRELRKKRGQSMASQILRNFRSFYAFMIDEGWYKSENPATKLKLHVPEKHYTPWTFERVRVFFEASVNLGRRSIGLGVVLIYETAQNPSDVLIYRHNQFDGKGISHTRGKTGEAAYTPLSPWARKIVADSPKEAVQIVVSEETLQPYKYDNFAHWVARIRKAAGLPDELKAGNLRHEAAQEAEQGGAGPGDIQALLAHKHVGTQRHYVDRKNATGAQRARAKYRRERKKNDG